MIREEILEKSRKEHNQQDLYEKEILQKAGSYSAITAAILATVFLILQITASKGINYGLYAIVFSVLASSFIVKAIYLKKRHEIPIAILYTIFVVVLSAAHIYTLCLGAG